MKKMVCAVLLCIAPLVFLSCGQIADVEETPSDAHNAVSEVMAVPIEQTSDDELSATTRERTESEITNMCIHERSGNFYFHEMSDVLIEYVGDKEFGEWYNEKNRLSELSHNPDCIHHLRNIVDFVKYFEISREEMQHLMNTTTLYYLRHNLDVIYSGDNGLVEKYYTSAQTSDEKIDGYLAGANYIIKSSIVGASGDEMDKYRGNGIRLFSMYEFVKKHDFPRDEFEKIVAETVAKYTLHYNIQYDIDMIYSTDERIDFMIKNGVDAEIIDNSYQTCNGFFRTDLIYQKVYESINAGGKITIEEILREVAFDRQILLK